MFAGEIHYFRLPVSSWRPCLRSLVELGFSAVDVPVPWSLHVPQRGMVEWRDSLDLRRFVELARELELAVVLRPGPHLGRELPGLGFPEWLSADPSMQARTRRGTPALWPFPPRMTPLPDYLGDGFRTAVEDWLVQLHGVLGPDLQPDELVLDHHLDLFHRRDLDLGGRSSGEALVDIDGWLRHAAAAAGLVAPVVRTSLPARPGAVDPFAGADRAPALELSSYGDPRTLPSLRSVLSASHIGDGPGDRIGITAGGSPFSMRRGPDDDASHLAAAVASGARQISVAMAVERDRWYGAWIDADGSITKHGHAMGRVLRALDRVGLERLQADAAVAVVGADGRSHPAIEDAIEGAPPILSSLLARAAGTDDSALASSADRQRQAWNQVVERALRLAQIPFRRIHAGADPGAVRAVVMPTLEPLDDDGEARLRAWASGGHGRAIIVGPTSPVTGAALPPRTGLLRAASLDDVDGLADDLLGACGDLPEDGIAPEQSEIECIALRDVDGVLRVLVVSNHGDAAEIELALDAPLRDPYAGASIVPDGRGTASVSARRAQVRLFVSEE